MSKDTIRDSEEENIDDEIERSISAPPIMKEKDKILGTGLFSFQSKYGHLFGDIRYENGYENFYMNHENPSKLPKPIKENFETLFEDKFLKNEEIEVDKNIFNENFEIKLEKNIDKKDFKKNIKQPTPIRKNSLNNWDPSKGNKTLLT
jgi:hypothetical protein